MRKKLHDKLSENSLLKIHFTKDIENVLSIKMNLQFAHKHHYLLYEKVRSS